MIKVVVDTSVSSTRTCGGGNKTIALIWVAAAAISYWAVLGSKGRAIPQVQSSIGSKINFPSTDVLGRTVSFPDKSRPSLLVFMASCTTCSLNALDIGTIRKNHFSEIILIFDDTKEHLLRTMGRVRQDVRVFSDRELRLSGFLHITTLPTGFLLDKKGFVRETQSGNESIEQFLRRIHED